MGAARVLRRVSYVSFPDDTGEIPWNLPAQRWV
jgi:hypothetical protein